jgi:hypothetical protein
VVTETKKKKKKADPDRSNSKPKVKRAPELPEIGEYEFQSDENREAAEAYFKHLSTVYSDEPGFQALIEFAKWGRDAIGWKMLGRVVIKGSTER